MKRKITHSFFKSYCVSISEFPDLLSCNADYPILTKLRTCLFAIFSLFVFGSSVNASNHNIKLGAFHPCTLDTAYPGVGYLNNSSTLGIWSVNSGAGSPVLVLTPDQNVGIGTTSPPSQYKLSVNGSAIFTRIKVKESGTWPDYVFHKDYKLPSLDSVEQFVKRNYHLPDVPSAATIDETPLDIGEHQAILLRKIEELTLYIIEQNKELLQQAKRINMLEAQLAKQQPL